LDDFNKFLRGEPLTPELEALAKGDEPQATTQPGDARPLDNDDREHLKRLRLEPGWPVVLRLWNRDIQQAEHQAKGISLDDPLGNSKQLADAWAYVAMLHRSLNRLVALIESEVQQIEQ